MTDRENFLERWSRKKAEAEREVADAPAEPERAVGNLVAEPSDAAPPAPATPKPEFDITSLPSLESITKATDIRAFLTPGVPVELTRAALRRAWTADPAIRDFVGLQENDWDFTNPNGVPGFGEISPDYDIKKLLAQLFGEPEKEADRVAATQQPVVPAETQPPQIVADSETPENTTETAPGGDDGADRQSATTSGKEMTDMASLQTGFVQRNSNIATHNIYSENNSVEPKTRRQHGRALPE